jgi:hypothetical protein
MDYEQTERPGSLLEVFPGIVWVRPDRPSFGWKGWGGSPGKMFYIKELRLMQEGEQLKIHLSDYGWTKKLPD